jgi:hypothetical protein
MNGEKLFDKLRKLLALTTSPVEGEAHAAAHKLQQLLTEHNLNVADLESRGQAKPAVREDKHDLGKAAFKWKLDLAEVMADHYYCFPLVDRYTKTVAFVGRPDNIKSLQMLYGWVIDQIKRIGSEERKVHLASTGEHVDPLRWQVGFGLGAVARLSERLDAMRQKAATTETALVVHHQTEISDYLEAQYGYRRDGQKTAREKQRDEEWAAAVERNKAAQAARDAEREADPEAYYAKYPDDHPDAQAARKAAREREHAKWRKREEQNARRRTGRSTWKSYSAEDERKDNQSATARSAGERAASRVNLEPFLDGQSPTRKAMR